MGVFDKIKNALFEVEYVEVEEPPKKEKKSRVREIKENKPIAKKIVLPGRKEEKIEELEEEELRDEDFEIRPKDEPVKMTREEFKMLDDKDFEMDPDEYIPGEPSILQVIDTEEEVHDNEGTEKNPEGIEETKEEVIQREEIVPQEQVSVEVSEEVEDYNSNYNNQNYNRNYNNSDYYSNRVSRPYGMDSSYNVPVHEYGTYEKYEEKSYFRPSPIISPIYGILDKNYKKEDVKEKKEVRLTAYSRSSVNVDDIREKAYGGKHEEEQEVETTFEVEEDEDNLMVDLSDRAKPEVKEITVGDAVEYFQDLGLEYNVDYVDGSKEKTTSIKKDEEDLPLDVLDAVDSDVKDEDKVLEDASKEQKKEEERKKVKDSDIDLDDDNDNLFDLIDSMYQENN